MWENSKMRRYWLQIFASMSGALATFTTGQLMGWASPSIPFLKSDLTPIIGGVSNDQASWVASLMMVGNIMGIVLVAFLADIIGRKKVILLSTIPIFTSWIILSTARHIEMLYFARILGGLGETLGKTSMFLYIGEIADANIRGALGTFLVISLNSGILYEYAIGPFVTFQNLALISAIIPVTLFATFMWMPESPYYFIMRNNISEAEKVLKRLRGGNDQDVSKELESIRSIVEKKLSKTEEIKLLFGKSKNRKILGLMCVLFSSQEFTGITPNIMYAEEILQEADIGFLSSEITPILFPIAKVIATILTTVLVDASGRRPLFMASSLACALSMTAMAGYMYVKDFTSIDITTFYWLPIVILLVYNFMFIIGVGCLPFIMIGELFPTNVKAVAVSISALSSPVAGIISTKVFQILADVWGRCTGFGFFAINAYLCFIFVTMFLPETKKQSLVEIQRQQTSN